MKRAPRPRPAVVVSSPTPGHGAYPSGHGTMAALFSELWIALLYAGQPAEWTVELAPATVTPDRLAALKEIQGR